MSNSAWPPALPPTMVLSSISLEQAATPTFMRREMSPDISTRYWNCSIRLEAWQNAQNQAIAVAKVMAGGTEPFAEVPRLWTDQYDMNMQIAGARQRGITSYTVEIPPPMHSLAF